MKPGQAVALLTHHHDPEVVPLDRVEVVEGMCEAVVVESSRLCPAIAEFARREVADPAGCFHLRIELATVNLCNFGRQQPPPPPDLVVRRVQQERPVSLRNQGKSRDSSIIVDHSSQRTTDNLPLPLAALCRTNTSSD